MLIITITTILGMMNAGHAMELLTSDAESTPSMIPVNQKLLEKCLRPSIKGHINIPENDIEKMALGMYRLLSRHQAIETLSDSSYFHTNLYGHFAIMTLQPDLEQNSIIIESEGSVIQLKVKNPVEPNVFLYWLFNLDTKEWQSISKDCHVYSKDEYEQKIQALHPAFGCSIEALNYGSGKGKALTLITNPLNIATQKVVIFSHRPGSAEFEEMELLTIKADTFNYKSNIIIYMATDGILHARRTDLSQDEMQLEEILPPQPDTITSWDDFMFFNQSLIAEHYIPRSLERQYYRIQDNKWVLLHQGPYSAQSLQMNVEGGLQLISYSEKGITIARFNCSTNTFEPTNVCNFPIQLINGEIKVSKTGSILALQDYEQGQYVWRFPESNADISESSSSAFATREDSQREYNALTKKISDKLEEYPAYVGRKFSLLYPSMSDDGHIIHLWFAFPENTFSKINKSCMESPLDEDTFSHGDAFHPPLQEHWVDDRHIPYFHVPSKDAPNGKTIILMEGGPESQYNGCFSDFIKTFTQDGWAVIIPQESNRTGHGWEHYSKGFGEMGRKNLHQLLHVFQDAISKNFIIDITQIHLFGHSYGGFVATSFALRWDELHAEAGLTKNFNFQSIISEAAFIDLDLEDRFIYLPAVIGTEDPMEFRQKYMPLHTVGASSSLSAPLTLIHGSCDVRCSAEYIRQFSSALNAKGYAHKLLWHIGGHSLKHDLYPAFLLADMNGTSTSEIEKDLFLS